MSQTSKGIVAAAVILLTLGAAQFASGRDLSDGAPSALEIPATSVNRMAKADRTAAAVQPADLTRTILFRPNDLPATSVVFRIPLIPSAQAVRNGVSASSWIRSGDRKTAVACEPVVSVLTEVAKRLQPGRCVT